MGWYSLNHRDFPWRNTTNPFHILISEVCLQKTGAKKAQPAYEIIIKNHPTPASLEIADPQKLLLIFKPIGFTRRANLLIEIAKQINREFSGETPHQYDELLKIKGVGRYIANAILVFAFGQTYPLIDEGIARVYRRVFGKERLKRAYADEELWDFATQMLPRNEAREYNWGLLDINALLCKPKQPNCSVCPLKKICLFVEQNQI